MRRERPHPGAQFCVFDAEGYRHTAFITDQDGAGIAALELRHRRRAKVEDEIRCGKDTQDAQPALRRLRARGWSSR